MLENYIVDDNGIVKQLHKDEMVYDDSYVQNRYNMYDTTRQMSYLRLGNLLGLLGPDVPKRLLDVGYGNGDFLITASRVVEKCFGFDVPPAYPLPDEIETVDSLYDREYDVVCFFDSLEHFEDIYEIKNLKTRYIYISVPWCHYQSDEWFEGWKHRRPNEHLWHFNLDALINFMRSIDYQYIHHSSIEDLIRKPQGDLPNILTGLFRKKAGNGS